MDKREEHLLVPKSEEGQNKEGMLNWKSSQRQNDSNVSGYRVLP